MIDRPTESRKSKLLTRANLCEQLKISIRTLSRMVATGQLPPPIYIGRSVRFRESDIEEWIAQECPPVDRATRRP
jgi:excisionase family DNA binding protein